MMLEASLLRFGGRGAFLNVLYVRCFAYTVSECGTKHLLLFTPFSVTRFAMHRIYAIRINSRGMSRDFGIFMPKHLAG